MPKRAATAAAVTTALRGKERPSDVQIKYILFFWTATIAVRLTTSAIPYATQGRFNICFANVKWPKPTSNHQIRRFLFGWFCKEVSSWI